MGSRFQLKNIPEGLYLVSINKIYKYFNKLIIYLITVKYKFSHCFVQQPIIATYKPNYVFCSQKNSSFTNFYLIIKKLMFRDCTCPTDKDSFLVIIVMFHKYRNCWKIRIFMFGKFLYDF